MCGRFANGLSYDEFTQAINTLLPDMPHEDTPNCREYHPTFNVAPGTRYPVVRAKESSLLVETMRWGVPLDRFASDSQADRLDGHRIINSRSDTLLKPKSLWYKLLTSHRCIVFCQGFFEWQKVPIPGTVGNVRRVAHFVGMAEKGQGRIDADGNQRKLMPMAGLWTEAGPNSNESLFTIVTTQSNKHLDFLHDRMPVILPNSSAISEWLGIVKQEEQHFEVIARLLKPYPSHLDCYAVPPEVGRVSISHENLILPVERRKDGILAMFASAKSIKKQSPNQDEAQNRPIVASMRPGKQESSPHLDTLVEDCHASQPRKQASPDPYPSDACKASSSHLLTAPHVRRTSHKRRKTDGDKAKGTQSLQAFWGR